MQKRTSHSNLKSLWPINKIVVGIYLQIIEKAAKFGMN